LSFLDFLSSNLPAMMRFLDKWVAAESAVFAL
jgi:hypothetical protein